MLDPVPTQIPITSEGGLNNPTWMKWFNSLGAAPIGYGGIYHRQNNVALSDLGAGWVTLQSDNGAVTNPVNVAQGATQNFIGLNVEGVWQLNIVGSLQFDEDQAGRSYQVRIFNQTQSTSSDPLTLGVGRNNGYSLFSVTTLIEGPSNLTDEFRVDVGNGDAFTNVIQLGYRFEAVLIDLL
jgi:hypothetical protein